MKICKRISCCFICALLIAFSPISNYVTSSVNKVYAADWVIIGGAGEVAIDYLVALLGTVGLGSAFVANRDEIIDLYNSKVQAEQTTREMAYDCAMKIYDKATDTVKSIPFDEYFDSLQSFADNTYDTVSDVYFKLSPEIISFTQEFVSDLVNGNILVNGEPIVEPALQLMTKPDGTIIEEPAIFNGVYPSSGTFVPRCYTDLTGTYYHTFFDYNYNQSYTVDLSTHKMCGVIVNNELKFCIYRISDSYIDTFSLKYKGYNYDVNTKKFVNSFISSSTGNPYISYSANFPVFSSYNDAINYFKGITTDGVLNIQSIGVSAWDTIIENNDIPDFSKEADKLWNRAIDHGIGLSGYGSGVAGTAEWSDDIPWLLNPSLRDWANDVIDRVRDSILDGTYVGNPDIPDNPSYVDVWDKVVDIPWDVVIDTDTPVSVPWDTEKPLVIPNNPSVDIDKPIVDTPSVDTEIPEVIEPTLPVVESISVSLKDKFPFCIPWDLVSLFNIFVAEPSPPYFEIPFNIEYLKLDYTFVLDLSLYNTVSKVCRSLFVILFILGLIKLTPFMLSFGKDL